MHGNLLATTCLTDMVYAVQSVGRMSIEAIASFKNEHQLFDVRKYNCRHNIQIFERSESLRKPMINVSLKQVITNRFLHVKMRSSGYLPERNRLENGCCLKYRVSTMKIIRFCCRDEYTSVFNSYPHTAFVTYMHSQANLLGFRRKIIF